MKKTDLPKVLCASLMLSCFVVVCTSYAVPLPQQFPDVAYNSTDNNFLVVWENVVSDDLYDISGAVLDAASIGQPIIDSVVLLTGDQSIEAPEITYNSTANEYLLVARRKSDNMALVQRISAVGQPVGDTVELGRCGGSTFFDAAARARVASVAYNSTEDRYIVGIGDPMSVQILMPDLELDLLSKSFGAGSNPSIAWSSVSNIYLMAWEDREFRSTGGENLSAVLVSNFAEADSDIIYIRDQDFAEESPRVAYNADDDQFLVIWDERFGYSDQAVIESRTDTIGQIVAADGSVIGDPIPIEADIPYTLRQDVDYNPTSQIYLVVWKGDPSGEFAFADIYGRYVNRDGSLNGPEFLIYDDGDDNTDMGDSERYFDESKLPAVAANTQNGTFLVVWEESGITQNPEDRHILSLVITPPGTAVSDWSLF